MSIVDLQFKPETMSNTRREFLKQSANVTALTALGLSAGCETSEPPQAATNSGISNTHRMAGTGRTTNSQDLYRSFSAMPMLNPCAT